jgi:GNAT superfamily N-acetyltransferase
VDWPATLNVNMDPGTGEDEQEIRLKPGARVRVVRVKRLGERASDKDTVETTEEMEMTAKVAATEIVQEGDPSGRGDLDFYADKDGKTVGFLSLRVPSASEDPSIFLDPTDTSYGISDIEVSPGERGKGLARLLITEAERVVGHRLGYNTAPTDMGRKMNEKLNIRRAKAAWGKPPAPTLDSSDLTVLDLWVQGSYTHHQGGVGRDLQAVKSKLGLSYGPTALYRACWLPDDQARQLQQGQEAQVSPSHAGEYQSWTGDLAKAREFHDRFLGEPKPGFAKVVLKATLPGADVVFRFSDVLKALGAMPLTRELTEARRACEAAASFDEYVCHLPGPVSATVATGKTASWQRSPITAPPVYRGWRDQVASKTGSIAWHPAPTIEVAPGVWISPVSKKGTYFTPKNFPKQQALVTPRPGTPGFYFVRIGCVTELWGSARDPMGTKKVPLGLEMGT